MKKNIIACSLLIIMLVSFSCKSPTEPNKSLALSVADVSCTEAWLNLNAGSLSLPANISINKNGNNFLSFTLTNRDTTIYDSALSPNQTYTYQAVYENNKNESVTAKTLDTTSSNFMWQRYYFGDGASDIFNDCTIISPNDIWCVGLITVYDSSISEYKYYNAVHWNGKNWELKSILFPLCDDNGNQNGSGPFMAKSVFANLTDNIWFTCGTSLVHWDGQKFNPICMPLAYGQRDFTEFSKLNDASFLIGTNGFIATNQNGKWEKIVSNTNWDILDIRGDINPFTNEMEIICGASAGFGQNGFDLVRIKKDLTTENLNLTGLGQKCSQLWFKAGIRYYVVGDGLYEKTYRDYTKWINLNENRAITSYYMSGISGTGLNNVVVVGSYGNFLHFNGITWKNLMSQTFLNNGTYYNVTVKDNIVVAVGHEGNQGVILLGNRQ